MNAAKRRQILSTIVTLTEGGLILWRNHDDFTYISMIDGVQIFISTDDYEDTTNATYTISGGDSELGIDEYSADQSILAQIYKTAREHVQLEPRGRVLSSFDECLEHIRTTFQNNIVPRTPKGT